MREEPSKLTNTGGDTGAGVNGDCRMPGNSLRLLVAREQQRESAIIVDSTTIDPALDGGDPPPVSMRRL